MRIMLADGPLVERVLDDTFPVWHEGLTRDAYSKWSRGQLRTPWGREHLQRFVLLDDGGGHVASLKRYRYPVRARRPRRAGCAASAPCSRAPGLRGRGHASRLSSRSSSGRAPRARCVAGLFSEIGTGVLRTSRVLAGAARRSVGARHSPRRLASHAGARRRRPRSAGARGPARGARGECPVRASARRRADSVRPRQEAAVRRA